jgi:DMSO/TMAO reductase YedYZ molybdopterin-dependent catalytic subunit
MNLPCSSPHSPPTHATREATCGSREVRPSHGGLIVRQSDPLNLESPFGALDSFITRNEDFFVRCHFSIPEIPRDHWRLKIGGEVQRPVEFKWDDLRAMPETTVTATIECAGNGRVFLTPKVDGAQWERGAVGNAVWTGVRLAEVFQRAGLRMSAREVILSGADRGVIESAPKPGGEIHYARSLPVAKASHDVLLAWQMNGKELTPAHGFPLRAIVPGWYGMASVKWLSEITAIASPFHGYYQSVDYAYWHRETGEPSLVPITELQVKAQIARPGPAERVPLGESYLVRGAAWSGEAEITRVEFSPDGGRTWHEAQLVEKTDRHAWRLWEFPWLPDQSGRATLMVRATDGKGRTQPSRRDADRGGYMINEVFGVDVSVE